MNTQYNTEVTSCYFCGSSSFKDHSEATYWKLYLLHFVECTKCGLIFANPMPNLDAVIAGNGALSIFHGSRGTLSQYRGGKEFTMVLQSIKPDGVLLDVGCAEGFFLLGIEENSDWRAEGLEIIHHAIEFGRNRLGVTIHHGTLDSLKNQDNRYDLIRMNNVIEHIQNPVQFLQKSYNLLRRNGTIFCSTPNGFQDGYFLKTANKRGFKFNLLENHFFYYKPKTLVQIFESCGFRIVESYCEDTSNTLHDFGLLPWFKYNQITQDLNLNDFIQKTNTKLEISKGEIESYKTHPSTKMGRLHWNRLKKNWLRLKFPASIPIGHQLQIIAQKS